MIPQGYKHTDIGIIPNEWEVKTLGEIANVTKLAGFEYSLHFNSYNDVGEIIVLRGTNITNSILDLSDVKTIPTSTSNKLLRSKLYKNDLVFAYVGTIGPIYLVEEDNKFHLGPNTSKITVSKNVDSTFLFHCFKSSLLRNEMNDNISIGAQPSLSMSKIRSFRIILPPLPEQQAIAQALSHTDALITNLQNLIAKKHLIKQGAMQELLTPKKGWEVKKLGEVCDIRKGQLITEETKINGNIPVIAGGKKPSYFHNKPNRIGKTITISGSGANAGYVSFHNYPIFASDCSTISENKNYSIEFIYFFLQLIQEKIYKMQTGGAQPHIHPSDVNPIEFSIPKTVEEQTQIATILTDMDNEITTLEQKLEKYKSIKQGMMQDLLTGKVRLV